MKKDGPPPGGAEALSWVSVAETVFVQGINACLMQKELSSHTDVESRRKHNHMPSGEEDLF